MEREGFIRSFDLLHQEVKLAEVCTDAHSQISALFSKSNTVKLILIVNVCLTSKDLI